MESIIITVTNQSKSYLYDLEVPINVTLSKLKSDIIDAMNGHNPSLRLNATDVTLFCNRLGCKLHSDETLESVGVWNGDYITILEV